MVLANLIGLLGLLSIVALIIIYIIKPNYQQKFVSSTFAWKLCLKYRKRKISSSKWRNLLIIICQILVLTACALILARPIIEANQPETYDEKIVIIEASANMLATDGVLNRQDDEDGTRFKRAVSMVYDLVDEMYEEDEESKVTIILAGRKAEILSYETGTDSFGDKQYAQIIHAGADARNSVLSRLRELDNDDCTFGLADIDGAMTLAEQVLADNPKSDVLFYSATEYINKGFVDVKYEDVRLDTEWNAAILSGTAELNDNYVYTFSLDVALYNADAPVEIVLEVYGANAEYDENYSLRPGLDVVYTLPQVTISNNGTYTFVLNTFDQSENDKENDWRKIGGDPLYPEDGGTYDGIYSFRSVRAYINRVGEKEGTIGDSLYYDDDFYFYDGQKPVIKVQYASDDPNPFYKAILSSWQTALAPKWDIFVKEVQKGKEPELEGYDLYIFEREMPETLPIDGVVFLISPSTLAPTDSDLLWSSVVQDPTRQIPSDCVLTGESPITAGLKNLESYEINLYVRLQGYGDYEDLMDCSYTVDGVEVTTPVMLIRNRLDSKVLLFTPDINFSDLSMYPDFSRLFLNVFNYFFPAPISQYMYEVGDTLRLNDTLGDGITLVTSGVEKTYKEFPSEELLEYAGKYTLTQRLMSGAIVESSFYVKMPARLSDTLRVENELNVPYRAPEEKLLDTDLLVYFAAALVALLFAERCLHSFGQN